MISDRKPRLLGLCMAGLAMVLFQVCTTLDEEPKRGFPRQIPGWMHPTESPSGALFEEEMAQSHSDSEFEHETATKLTRRGSENMNIPIPLFDVNRDNAVISLKDAAQAKVDPSAPNGTLRLSKRANEADQTGWRAYTDPGMKMLTLGSLNILHRPDQFSRKSRALDYPMPYHLRFFDS